MFKIFLTLLILTPSIAFSAFDSQLLTVSIGLTNISYKENQSATSSTSTTTTTASGSVSVLPLDFHYELYLNEEKSIFAHTTVPLLTASKDSYVFLGGGMNFYFKSLSSTGTFVDSENILKIIPKIRYYWGVNGGAGYLVYNTVTAKKSDLTFELGAHIGGIYAVNEKWSLRGEAAYDRSLGVATTSSGIKIFMGFSKEIF